MIDFALLPYRLFWKLIWDYSEEFESPFIRKYAHVVFSQMMGWSGKQVIKKKD